MDSTRLVQIRKDFYLNIRRRVQSIIGAETRDLRLYRQAYDRELSRSGWQAVDKRHLFKRLRSASVVLIGDFHAQKQSTRGFLRVIRKIKSEYVIAMECLTVKDQPAVDRFLKGETTEKEFLRQVGWKKNWGFPWENYKPLFKWAQANQIRIYGINTRAAIKNLNERDRFSAECINKIRKLHKKAQVFVQYGDLHLAPSHLPRAVAKVMPNEDICVIYQSPESLYFKIMEMQKELSTDVVRLTDDRWALNGLPPWIKWQDYLLYLESGQDKKVRAQDVEPTDTVAHTVDFLSRSFGLKTSAAALSVYTSDDNDFFDRLGDCSVGLRNRIIENVQDGSSFYIPELECGYLARYSVNHVTRVAAQYIYYQEGAYLKTLMDPKKDFLKLIWLETVVYFCSKVKNPKRKTDTLQDIRDALQKEQFDDRGKEALMLALSQKLSEMQFLSNGRFRPLSESVLRKHTKKSFYVAAQIIGGIMGEKVFSAFSKKLLRLPENKVLIFKNLQSPSFSKAYYESLEMIESWPVGFRSKYDKL